MINNDSFYKNLPPINNFADISDPSIYTEMPDDWYIAVSDVKNSTNLIHDGGYKRVNLVGASTIMAILNIRKDFSLPFIFGGDGACVCIPESMIEQTRVALLGTRSMAKDLYGIELRVGIVPIRFVREQGYNVLVAPCRLSTTFSQAAFSGGGLNFAEDCLKDPAFASIFNLKENESSAAADFTGLECRWENVPSARGEIVSLIVQALGENEEKKNSIYREVIGHIEDIYGSDAQSHPLQEQLLTMSFSEKQLFAESDVRSYGKGKIARFKYWFGIRWGVILGRFLMWTNYATKHYRWGTYKKRLIDNTDFKKFDDKIRQVLSGSPAQREQLTTLLQKKFESGELVYGIHTASSALITCLLFNYNNSHIHLVDSSEGGYAMAALQLKDRSKELERK